VNTYGSNASRGFAYKVTSRSAVNITGAAATAPADPSALVTSRAQSRAAALLQRAASRCAGQFGATCAPDPRRRAHFLHRRRITPSGS
jgi:hypothetical protein